MLGNFPQALSHIALTHAAFTLSGQWTPEPYAAGNDAGLHWVQPDTRDCESIE